MASYSEKDISFFESDLAKIRAKPALYIGALDSSGIFKIISEVLDNGVDEHRAGRNNYLHLWAAKDGSFWVLDHGVGIPVKKHPQANVSTLTHVLMALQSSGKMKGNAYESAIGTHGVGIKATNALSTNFEVWTYRQDAGGWWYTAFAKGKEITKPRRQQPDKFDGQRPKRGTMVRIVPDYSIFAKGAKFRRQDMMTWAEITAYMNAGLEIKFTDEAGKTKSWYSKHGIKDYLVKQFNRIKADQNLPDDLAPLSRTPFYHQSTEMDVTLHFAEVNGCNVEFATNTIRNPEGGEHARAFFHALEDALKPFAGRAKYKPKDLQDGVIGLLNYKINAAQFDSQTKEKLVDQRVYTPCYDELEKELSHYFKANKSLAKRLIERASRLRELTNAFMADKNLNSNVRKAKNNLAAKLAGVNKGSKVPWTHRELYIVEGDSAAGNAKAIRDNSYQATLAIRGKVANVFKMKKGRKATNGSGNGSNDNLEVANILAAMGINPAAKDPLANLNYGRVILLADPDVDGKHINCLLEAVLWQSGRKLFDDGRVFLVKSPEFICRYNGRVYFASTREEMREKTSPTAKILHIKGWGEVNVDDLRIAFDPKVRVLYRVNAPRDQKGVANFRALMAEDPQYRKKILNI